MSHRFAPFERKMRTAGLPQVAIDTFRHYYECLVEGGTGTLPSRDIQPVESVPDSEGVADRRPRGVEVADRAVVIKLNGGLGTTMGMTRAKSLLPVKDGLSFLDIIARQVLHLRREYGCRLPLVLMNSFRTREDSLEVLARYPDLAADVPLDFLQHKVPRILVDGLAPVEWPSRPEYEWCPPGHGDIYPALLTSGMLEALLARGYRYAFVSNADNLGAVLDPAILGFVASQQVPLLMEVADRTQADRKGGHLAGRVGGGLTLRESAQCPAEEIESFRDIRLHRYFNTNNLWVDLAMLREVLDERGGVLGLPMIRNEKTVDPTDPASPRVYQLETAMGAAIAVFEGAQALRVPHTRFAPVKTTNDLLGVWSDAYVLADDCRVIPNPQRRPGPLVVDLDPAFYKNIDDLIARFPKGAPSLVSCRRFALRGDVRFGRGVVATGDVEIRNDAAEPLQIPDGESLGG